MPDLIDILADQLSLIPRELWNAVRSGYRTHRLVKPGLTNRRTLSIPNKPLRQIQNCLAGHLGRLLPPHPAAHGFVHDRSIVTAAAVHTAPGVLVTADLADWYGHITARHVRGSLTRVLLDDRSIDFVLEACLKDGKLPQGAPTSPVLANAVARPLDERLSKLHVSYGHVECWRYSRFADDLTFSIVEPLGRPYVKELLRRVRACLRLEGQKLAKGKLHIARPHQAQRVQGLVVNADATKGGVRLTREFHRRLRAALHNQALPQREGLWSREQLRSAISQVQMVEPKRATKYLESYEAGR